MHDRTTPLAEFLAATAARQPTPGGGAVAAVAGALAAAIGEMVLNYSVGRKDLAAHEPALRQAVAELQRARELLLQLMAEDQTAFADLTAARKAGTDPAAITAALWACVRGPQAVAATGLAILHLSRPLVDKVNRYLLSDLAVSAELAAATVRAAAHNVRVNLPSFESAANRDRLAAETDALVASAVAAVRELVPAITARMAHG